MTFGTGFGKLGASFGTLGASSGAGGGGAPSTEAAIVVLVGQSLNAPRGTALQNTSDTTARMFVGGAAVAEWAFFAVNAQFTANWTSLASLVSYEEPGGQTPGTGILSTMADANTAINYCVSAAVGASTIDALSSRGPRANTYAAVHRMCDLARAAGLTPKVYYYFAQGEADGAAGTDKATYIARVQAYCAMLQVLARQAMEDAAYVAPIIYTHPIQTTAAAYKEIHIGLMEAFDDIPGSIDGGAIYQWPTESDNIHPATAGYIQRGEHIGRIIKSLIAGAPIDGKLRMTAVTLSGATFQATFNRNIVRDTTLGVGESLDASNAFDGFQWFDNGTAIAINNVTYAGAVATGTLASTPAGTIEQQNLRIALQTASVGSGDVNATRAGSQVRADEAGWLSLYDTDYTNYIWAVPQSFTSVVAV